MSDKLPLSSDVPINSSTQYVSNSVYEADDDSFLLADVLKKELSLLFSNKGLSYSASLLDVGCGSGYVGFSSLENFPDNKISLTLLDKNPLAVEFSKKQLEKYKKINSDGALIFNKETHKVFILESDLFSNLNSSDKNKFDIITFNTPYLPNEETVFDMALHGGERGNEIALEFLSQAKNYLKRNGFILLLTSSLVHPNEIESYAKEKGFESFIVATENQFFEKLIVYKFVMVNK